MSLKHSGHALHILIEPSDYLSVLFRRRKIWKERGTVEGVMTNRHSLQNDCRKYVTRGANQVERDKQSDKNFEGLLKPF